MRSSAVALALLTVTIAGAVPLSSQTGAMTLQDTAHAPVVEQAPELPGEALEGGAGGVVVEPELVVTGMFYTGATVHVSAVVPAGADVAVLCRGEGHPLTLKRKGKVLGLLWMNVGDVSFEQVPALYLLDTSRPLGELAADTVLDALGLGVAALATRCDADASDPVLFSELARLKQKERLWRVAEGAVEIRSGEGGAELAVADLPLPPKAGPGDYEVLVYAFGSAQPELIGTGHVRVEQGGVSGFITELATKHGLLYGVLAALVAVVVGLLTGLIFGMGSKGH